MQECGIYQTCRMFIENIFAVEIAMSAVKIQAAIIKSKFGNKQHDKVLRKQQSLSLRQKTLFSGEDIIKEYFALHYRTAFTFKKHMLIVESDEKGRNERPPNHEKERQEDLEKVGYYFIRINLDKPGFDDYEDFGLVSSYIFESIEK